MPQQTYIVFGKRPSNQYIINSNSKKSMSLSKLRSPYNTPVVNDPDLLPSSSIVSKYEARATQRKDDMKGNPDQSSATSTADIFVTYVDFDTVKKIRKCWQLICSQAIPAEHNATSDLMNYDSSLPTEMVMKEDLKEDMDGNDDDGGGASDISSTLGSAVVAGSIHQSKSLSISTSSPTSSALFDSAMGTIVKSNLDIAKLESSAPTVSPTTMHTLPPRTASDGMILWCPQKIVLQVSVHKRGGELFALTAAGTHGRPKAPWRRTRLERLETDLNHITEQEETLGMSLQDLVQNMPISYNDNNLSNINDIDNKNNQHSKQSIIELLNIIDRQRPDLTSATKRLKDLLHRVKLQKQFLKYQYDHFHKIIKGQVKDLKRRKELQQLKEGQALSVDETLSIELEHRMAMIIQRQIRRKFGRVFRTHLRERMEKATLLFQRTWRKYMAILICRERSCRRKLALIIQRVWRGRKARKEVRVMWLLATKNSAANFIQRIWRGRKGRQRSQLKKEFLMCIENANNCVLTDGLRPALVEELSLVLNDYLSDYNKNLPIELLTLLRGILYLFNGDEPEQFQRENLGEIDTEYVTAKELSWEGAKKLLARKIKFLRRLRGLAMRVRAPNASRLVFVDNCARHLTAIVSHVKFDHFAEMGAGKVCAEKLLEYIINLKRVYDLQPHFPEHFEIIEPNWLRQVLNLRSSYEKAQIKVNVASFGVQYLSKKIESSKKDGSKWGSIAVAKVKLVENLDISKQTLLKIKKKLQIMMDKLYDSENRHLNYLNDLQRAKEHSVIVAKREVEEFITCRIVDDIRLEALKFIVAERTMALLEVKAKVAGAKMRVESDREQRDFEKLMNFQEIEKWTSELAEIEANLLVMQHKWNTFLEEIGGIQFIPDIRGNQKVIYKGYCKEINVLIRRRRELLKFINEDIKQQLFNVALRARKARSDAILFSFWDRATDVEVEAESQEDKECARQSTILSNISNREDVNKLLQLPTVHPPVLIAIDIHIPSVTKVALVERLRRLNFVDFVELGEDISLLAPKMQIEIDNAKQLVLFADFGIHRHARKCFIGKFRSLVSALNPNPRVVAVDGFTSYRLSSWFSTYAIEQHCISFDNIHSKDSMETFGRIRYYADLFRYCSSSTRMSLTSSAFDDITAYLSVPSWIIRRFQLDYSQFLFSCQFGDFSRPSTAAVDFVSGRAESGEVVDAADPILAAAVSCILGLWKAPIVAWSSRDLSKGSKAFSTFSSDIHRLFRMMLVPVLPDGNPLVKLRYDRIREMESFKRSLKETCFSTAPARYILLQWCVNVFNFTDICCECLGGTSVAEGFDEIAKSTLKIDWNNDIVHSKVDGLLSQILRASFKDYLVSEISSCDVTVTAGNSSMASLNDKVKRIMKIRKESKLVSLYQYNNEVIFDSF